MNGKLRQSAFRAQCLAGLMQPLMIFIGNLGYVAVCVMGAVLTMNHQIGFEVIVAFMMYVRFFTQPLSQIAQATQTLQSGAAAGERVFEFLEAPEMEDESGKTAHLSHVQRLCGIRTREIRILRMTKSSSTTFPPGRFPDRRSPSSAPPAPERQRWSIC